MLIHYRQKKEINYTRFDRILIENDWGLKIFIQYLNNKHIVKNEIINIDSINILDDEYVFIDYTFYNTEYEVPQSAYHRMYMSVINDFILYYNRKEKINNLLNEHKTV